MHTDNLHLSTPVDARKMHASDISASGHAAGTKEKCSAMACLHVACTAFYHNMPIALCMLCQAPHTRLPCYCPYQMAAVQLK